MFAKNLLTIPHPTKANHYGGQLQFGPDGDLYISTGDGGGENDLLPQRPETSSSQLGKILRLDPTRGPRRSTRSRRNPFAPTATPTDLEPTACATPSASPSTRLSGDMVIGDVGQGAREEVDFAPSPFPAWSAARRQLRLELP